MRTAFIASWYDPATVEARARAAGWDGEEGLLDRYHPEEDSRCESIKEFPSLKAATDFLKKIIADGKDFWGQAHIREYEVNGPRCQYCTCRGWKQVREYVIEETGIVDNFASNDCADDE